MMTDNKTPQDCLPVARPIYTIKDLPSSAEGVANDMFAPVTTAISCPRAFIELSIVGFFLFLPIFFAEALALFGLELPMADISELGKLIYVKVVISGSLLVCITWFLIHRDGQSFKSLGLRFDNFGSECSAVILTLVLVVTVYGLSLMQLVWFFPNVAFGMIEENAKLAGLFPPLSFGLRLLFVLFVGFYEEILFRGFAITRLNVLCKYSWISIIISSVLFGLVHSYQQPVGIVLITLLALVFGGMYALRGRLVAVMLAHALWDFVMLSQTQ
jgi:membrane protease YdiL (CAAX protease family)